MPPKKIVKPEKQVRSNLLMPLAIVGAATILGVAIVIGTSVIADSIFIGNQIIAKKIGKLSRSISKHKKYSKRPYAKKEFGFKKVEEVKAGSNNKTDNPNAKVTMIEFSDLNCPYSRKFHQEIFPKIEKEFISTGRINFSYRHFPLGPHPEAKKAAVALECAAIQGKFWPMLDKLAASDDLNSDVYDNYAKELGLNARKFSTCLDKEATIDIVENDIKQAREYGVTGTPTLFINGRLIAGAYPYLVFKKIIEKELSQEKD